MDADRYKDALRRFAAGVTVITTNHEGSLRGMTAISFTSVSLDPPLILACLEKGSRTRDLVTAAGWFGVSILEASQEPIARRFSQPGDKSFAGVAHRVDERGIPYLEGAIAHITCRTIDLVPGGDHDVFIGEVTDTATAAGSPLIYYDRDYRSLGSV